MDIILCEDFPSLGYVGDTIKVRAGYARNFLIPRGVAVEASVHNQNLFRHRLSGITAKKIRLRSEAEVFAKRIEALELSFHIRTGAQGKMFGSVTVKDIEASLKKEGYALDRRQIKLGEPIKKPGEHKVSIKLHSEVFATLIAKVRSDMPEKVESKGGTEAEAKKKGRAKKTDTEGGEREARSKRAKEEGAEPAGDQKVSEEKTAASNDAESPSDN